ncbi:hypothetical protein BS17DRAFT_774776 [Gyrodon lividus]|nr:hypothetical protein BS17DRAFT_774776 [Gyrodon lividus]
MGYLQELSLCMERDVDVNLLAGGRTFPALKRLKVNAYTLSQCTALLSLVTSSSLESISFLYDVQAPCTLLEVFFRQVQRTCSNTITACSPLPSSSSSRLRPSHSISLSLKHNLGPFTSVSPPFLIRPSGTLSPLLALPHLRALRLFGLGTVAMDDAFLKEAADAWGECLEELEVRGVPWRERNAWEERLKAATLGGVGAFVKRCWRLKNLRLTFDGRCVPEEGGRVVGLDADAGTRTDDDDDDVRADDKGHPHPMSPLVSSLQVLNVRDSPIDNPEGVAKFLRRIAPALRMIHVEGCMETSKMWKEVEGRIKSVESR